MIYVVYIFRFGSFEIFKTRDMTTGRTGPSVGLTDILHQLVDYVIENFYPEVCMYVHAYKPRPLTCFV